MKSGKQTLESMSQAVWYNTWTLKKFNDFLKGDILEVGCGIGNFTENLIRYGKVWAIDINEEYVTQARREVKGKAQVGFGDIEKGEYFFKKKTFRTIVCINVLEHINHDSTALKNMYDLLDSNGYLILLVPAHQFLYNLIDQSIGHYRRYQKDDLKLMLREARLEVVKVRELNFLGSLGWFISGKLFKEKKVSENKIKIFNVLSPLFLLMENFFEPPFGTSILVIARKKSK